MADSYGKIAYMVAGMPSKLGEYATEHPETTPEPEPPRLSGRNRVAAVQVREFREYMAAHPGADVAEAMRQAYRTAALTHIADYE